MSRSIEQNLLSLMPTHGPQLPHRLVDTARTLLTQSRQRASTLKADEEVARMYACAHIACERSVADGPRSPQRQLPFRHTALTHHRLKIPLDLPPIEARPPIPPRVYQRLFTHLDNILPGRQSRVKGPSIYASKVPQPSPRARTPENHPPLGSAVKRSQPRALDRSVSRSASRVTPRQITVVHTPSKSTSKGFVGRVDPDVGLHPWIRGVLGVLISEMRRQKWGKIVLAGVQHVVAPRNRRTADKWVNEHLPAAVAAVFAASMFVVDGVIEGHQPHAKEDMAERTVDIMRRARRDLDVKGMSDDEFWDGWSPLRAGDVLDGIDRVEREWGHAEWFEVLVEMAEAQRDRVAEEDPGSLVSGGRSGGEGPRVRKADTMHLETYNFLSREARNAYGMWKEGIMARIAQAEGTGDGRSVAGSE